MCSCALTVMMGTFLLEISAANQSIPCFQFGKLRLAQSHPPHRTSELHAPKTLRPAAIQLRATFRENSEPVSSESQLIVGGGANDAKESSPGAGSSDARFDWSQFYLKFQELSSKVDKLQESNNHQQAQINILTEDNSNLKAQVNILTEDNSNLKAQVNTLTEDNSNLKAQVNILTEDNSNLKAQVNILTKDNSNLKAQVHSLTEDNSNLKAQVNNLGSQVCELTVRTAKLSEHSWLFGKFLGTIYGAEIYLDMLGKPVKNHSDSGHAKHAWKQGPELKNVLTQILQVPDDELTLLTVVETMDKVIKRRNLAAHTMSKNDVDILASMFEEKNVAGKLDEAEKLVYDGL